MADYSSPTVVRPSLPAEAITMLELMVLTEIYDFERDGATVYFFAQDSVPTQVQLDTGLVRDLVDKAPEGRSSIVAVLRKKLEGLQSAEDKFDFEVTDMEDAAIFQDILHRAPQIDHISITSGWTCSRMRPDGFGGSVTVVTREQIQSCSTQQMEERLLDLAEFGIIGCPPGQGEHKVVVLREDTVRSMLVDIEKASRSFGEQVVPVTDSDLREGCRGAISTCQLDAFGENLAFSAAQAAHRIAWRRAA